MSDLSPKRQTSGGYTMAGLSFAHGRASSGQGGSNSGQQKALLAEALSAAVTGRVDRRDLLDTDTSRRNDHGPSAS